MPERLLDTLHQFTQTILNPFDLDDLLSQLIGHTVRVLDAAGAGIMLADREGQLGFAAASGQEVIQMEMVQEHSGSGVCYHAFVTNQVVVAGDLDGLSRWPDYTERALDLGFESVIGVPLNACGQTIGVLNASQMRAQHDLAEQLQAALDSRGVIERAKGILMATEGVDADTAFAALRKASMDSNRKLRDVATELVERNEAADV